MRNSRLQISVLVLLLWPAALIAQNQYPLYIRGVDKDSAEIVSRAGVQTSFTNRLSCTEYINKLPGLLQSGGYVTVSIDSLRFDSTYARVVLFLGQQYKWAVLDAKHIEAPVLDAVGWREKMFAGKPIDFTQVKNWENRILDHLENNGFPFAKVYLDSLQLDGDNVSAFLKLDKGPLYKIDSTRIFGEVRVSKNFMERWLEIPNGTVYNKEKILRISNRIKELSYLEEEKPADLTLLGNGSVLNLYLKPKKSSQVNLLIGFLPNNNQLASKKMLITGEGTLHLKNALGAGETIGLNFQALQVSSQRLNLIYQHPYLFNSPLGLDFSFDIFRKDSSFVNINLQLGAQYALNANQAGKLFVQKVQTIVSEGGVNSPLVIQSRRLPDVADVNSFNVGVDYEFNNTDYRLNPRKGNEVRIITSIGTKKIKKNNEIISLKDPGDPAFDFNKLYDTVRLSTYQLRVRLQAVKYLPLGNVRSTVKTAINAGLFQSGNIFRNELFQLGGYRLLRGFDEESQYLSSFAIGTAEYHYLVGQNSYFYALLDGGWGQDNGQRKKINHTYIGTGLGLAFETKAGIFNLAWAIGKRNDTEFNLRQSKIHFGFINYF